jgi:hypothetical protein
MNDLEIPRPGTELATIRQTYADSEAQKENPDRNDPKMHLYSFTAGDTLILTGSNYDWYGMKTLGIALGRGELPEHYRDGILPSREGNTFVFRGEHPNNTNSHSVVITSDNHVVLATRGQAVDYYAGYIQQLQ